MLDTAISFTDLEAFRVALRLSKTGFENRFNKPVLFENNASLSGVRFFDFASTLGAHL